MRSPILFVAAGLAALGLSRCLQENIVRRMMFLNGGHPPREQSNPESIGSPFINTTQLPAKQPYVIPSLENLINDAGQVVGDVSGLLDYAILGMPKCGTSYLNHWLRRHRQTAEFEEEMCGYLKRKEARAVKSLYELTNDPNIIRGFKCPQAWTTTSVNRIREHFTNARLIFGVRHPVSWFQSLYDYRVANGFAMPNATTLIGAQCENPENHNVCTDRAFLHEQLLMLGKTDMSSKEMELISDRQHSGWNLTKNPVFLYDVHQLGDRNAQRKAVFTKDLQTYIGLTEPMTKPPNHKKAIRDDQLPICNAEYDELRAVLLEAGRKSSEWILTYFLQADNVYVSNMEHFKSELDTWKTDPCKEI